MNNMDQEPTFHKTMDTAVQYLEKAYSTLDQFEDLGTYRESALRSKMNLIMELATDEPAEIGISPEILEKCGVV